MRAASFPRLAITLLSRQRGIVRTKVIHSAEEAKPLVAGEQDEVILDLPAGYTERELYALIAQLYPLSCEISMVPRVFDMLTGAARIGHLDRPSLIRITEQHMTDSELCIKRASDIVLALAGVIVLSPLMLFIAIAVWCSSKGPAMYDQERIGLYGRPFRIFKFRTMINQAEADGIPQITADNDPRVTCIGHWLRKYRLDELPQLFNILRGDMSIVGPRPCVVYELGDYATLNKRYKKRFEVIAGLTGYAQIQGRNELDWDVKVDFDNQYIDLYKKWGVALDVYIILRTVLNVFHATDIYEKKIDENISNNLSAELAQNRVVELAHQPD